MKRLADFSIFVAVVKAGTLSEASKALDLSVAAVSKNLSRIERELGVRLLVRSSRGLKLTDEGGELYQNVERLLVELEAVVSRVSQASQQPQGTLRISSSIGLGRKHIVPLVSEFAERYPELSVQLNFSEPDPDATSHLVDVAIVLGKPQDSSLVARHLMDNPCVPCASPRYLERHPVPVEPTDLQRHECLLLDCPGVVKDQWLLEDESGRRFTVRVHGGLITDNSDTLSEWVREGRGIALKSLRDIQPLLESGELVRLLPKYQAPDLDYYLVYAGRELIPAKIRAFVDFVEENASRSEQAL